MDVDACVRNDADHRTLNKLKVNNTKLWNKQCGINAVSETGYKLLDLEEYEGEEVGRDAQASIKRPILLYFAKIMHLTRQSFPVGYAYSVSLSTFLKNLVPGHLENLELLVDFHYAPNKHAAKLLVISTEESGCLAT